MRREQGLIWHGRWGACDPSVVNVLAPVVIVLEVGLQDALDEDIRWGQILEVVGKALCTELSGNGLLVAIHWKPNWQAARHRRLMHALILGEVAACHTIWQQHWQHARRLLKDKAFVFWKDIVDTADPDKSRGHCRQLYGALQLRNLESPGLALELPAEWVEGMVESQNTLSSALLQNCEWERFFQLFGRLSLIERIINESGRAVLLACFEEPQAALAMYECLAGRCLYYPSAGAWKVDNPTNCFPAFCTVRDYDALKAQLYRKERVQDDEPAFVLRRIASGVKPEPPEVILVTTAQPTLVCGREGSVDVSLRAPHVSKVHAVLYLSRDGSNWKLTIEDKSSNGTWVNGTRLRAEARLKTCDQICFVPPGNGTEQLVYEVVQANMLQRTASHPPQVLDPEPEVRMYARSRSRSQEENISIWLQSVGDPDLLIYEKKLLAIVAKPSDIRNKYGDNISGFLADLNVSDQHKSSFRRALLKLRREI